MVSAFQGDAVAGGIHGWRVEQADERVEVFDTVVWAV